MVTLATIFPREGVLPPHARGGSGKHIVVFTRATHEKLNDGVSDHLAQSTAAEPMKRGADLSIRAKHYVED